MRDISVLSRWRSVSDASLLYIVSFIFPGSWIIGNCLSLLSTGCVLFGEWSGVLLDGYSCMFLFCVGWGECSKAVFFICTTVLPLCMLLFYILFVLFMFIRGELGLELFFTPIFVTFRSAIFRNFIQGLMVIKTYKMRQ